MNVESIKAKWKKLVRKARKLAHSVRSPQEANAQGKSRWESSQGSRVGSKEKQPRMGEGFLLGQWKCPKTGQEKSRKPPKKVILPGLDFEGSNTQEQRTFFFFFKQEEWKGASKTKQMAHRRQNDTNRPMWKQKAKAKNYCLTSKSCLISLRPHGLTVACQAPLSMGFARQEYWSGLLFPSPGDLPDLGIDPVSPAWQADSLPLSHLGSPGAKKLK